MHDQLFIIQCSQGPGLCSTQELLIEDPAAVPSSQHAGLMHPFIDTLHVQNMTQHTVT